MYDVSTLSRHKPGIPTERSVWLRPEPAARRPKHSRDDIAEAALRIADQDGLEAVSMRRVAAELDAGTMTLYHYVSTKAELLALLFDAVIGELLVEESEWPDDWRAATMAIAEKTKSTLLRHPWVLDIVDPPGGLGPNAVRHYEQSHRALVELNVSLAEKVDIIAAVDEYIFGYCKRRREIETGSDDDESLGEQLAYLHALVNTGEFPYLAKMTAGEDVATMWRDTMKAMSDPARFERHVGSLLDAFAATSFPDRRRR